MFSSYSVDVQHQQTIGKQLSRHFSQLKCLFFALFLISPALAVASPHCLTPQQQLNKVIEWVKVSKIIDGDTIHLRDTRKIRIIGINTPEIGYRGKPSQAFARQAKNALQKILKKYPNIGLYFDHEKKDKYQRVLAFIILEDGRSITEILLQQGLAHSIVVPPNDQQAFCFRQIEKKARQLNLGLWQLADKKIIAAHSLPKKSKGYYFISGKISAYNETKKSIYLKLTKKLSIRIARKDMRYFPKLNLKALTGQQILVRGWVNSYKGRQSIHIRSAYDLQIE